MTNTKQTVLKFDAQDSVPELSVTMVDDKILVRPDETAQCSGWVVAVGPGCATVYGQRVSLEARVGDIVRFAPFDASDVKIGDEELRVLKHGDILAILR